MKTSLSHLVEEYIKEMRANDCLALKKRYHIRESQGTFDSAYNPEVDGKPSIDFGVAKIMDKIVIIKAVFKGEWFNNDSTTRINEISYEALYYNGKKLIFISGFRWKDESSKNQFFYLTNEYGEEVLITPDFTRGGWRAVGRRVIYLKTKNGFKRMSEGSYNCLDFLPKSKKKPGVHFRKLLP